MSSTPIEEELSRAFSLSSDEDEEEKVEEVPQLLHNVSGVFADQTRGTTTCGAHTVTKIVLRFIYTTLKLTINTELSKCLELFIETCIASPERCIQSVTDECLNETKGDFRKALLYMFLYKTITNRFDCGPQFGQTELEYIIEYLYSTRITPDEIRRVLVLPNEQSLSFGERDAKIKAKIEQSIDEIAGLFSALKEKTHRTYRYHIMFNFPDSFANDVDIKRTFTRTKTILKILNKNCMHSKYYCGIFVTKKDSSVGHIMTIVDINKHNIISIKDSYGATDGYSTILDKPVKKGILRITMDELIIRAMYVLGRIDFFCVLPHEIKGTRFYEETGTYNVTRNLTEFTHGGSIVTNKRKTKKLGKFRKNKTCVALSQ
jgi:hypothetical protein